MFHSFIHQLTNCFDTTRSLIDLHNVKLCVCIQMKPDGRLPHRKFQLWTHHVSAGEKLMSGAGGAAQQRVVERGSQEVRGYYIIK